MEQTSSFLLAAGVSAAAAVVTTGGILTVRRFQEWARTNSAYFASFAAGVLISVSFLYTVPQSLAANPQAPAYVFAGYLFMYFFNRFLTAYVCDRPQTADYAIGLLPLVGISFHSFVDGVVYTIGFSVGALTGVLVATGMVLHEFPEGIVTYALLIRGGFSDRRALILSLIAAALTTPLGALISYPFISSIKPSSLGLLLALSAGALIYVGATHLLPQAEREPRRFSFLAVIAGVLVAFGLIASNR